MMALIKSWSVPTDWLPSSPGAILLLLVLALLVSWWLTGRFFKEQDLITLIFRCLVSLLICFAIGLFHRSLFGYVREGPMAPIFEPPVDKEKPIRENLPQWVTPAACAFYWKPAPLDPRKVQKMSQVELRDVDASQVDPGILVESAVRGLTWMALEHRQPSPFGRNAFPHSERGTKVLNTLTVPQAQAMFEYLRLVSPGSIPIAQPYLEDALAYCRELLPPAEAVAHPSGKAGEVSEKPSVPQYPHVEVSRPAAQGRAFVVRMSPTQVRVIEAASEEEALRKAKQP